MHEQAVQREIILGVDTHLDLHVGAVIDGTGKLLGTLATATTAGGYQQLIAWARSLGLLHRAGVEGTGTYGAGLARALREQGVEVLEVNRPDRSKRRLVGKSDPIDAESAARSVLSGQATAIPKSHDGVAEALRTISVARRSAVKAKTQAINQLRAMLVSAPAEIRGRLWHIKAEHCIANCAALCQLGTTTHLIALTATLRLLAKRWLMLKAELKELDAELEQLTLKFAPNLREQFGVGPLTAATLIVAAGDNPERLRSEAALAALCGVSPLQASSGKTSRHRLNRGGNRQANNALWTIALVRMRSEPRTRAYVEKRTNEGLSNKEIHRCVSRYVARELYTHILADLKTAAHNVLT
jgi:transposase